jgi:hypothetical protein
MKILFCGDIVGRSGREIACKLLPSLRQSLNLDWVIINGENAASGFGITEDICKELYKAGVDVITTGNHVWDQKSLLHYIDQDRKLLRPLNYPRMTPGAGLVCLRKEGKKDLVVVNLMTRLFMETLDDPFACMMEVLDEFALNEENVGAIVVDIHGEANSEKMAFAHYVDGKVSFVVGTHTHIPTADAHILSHGTAYQTDAGMCGDYDSVIGMEKQEAIGRFVRRYSESRLSPALGEATLCGVYVEINDHTGLADYISSLRLGGILSPAWPAKLDSGILESLQKKL